MKMRLAATLTAVIVVLGAGPAPAQTQSGGYLSGEALPDSLRILPPPPKPGSGREAEDRAVFAATRSLAGGPRWSLATDDADLHVDRLLADFSCALGVTLDAANAPSLVKLLGRVGADAKAVVDPPKDHYQRPRPFLADAAAPICVAKTTELAQSASYPSGHTTVSWAAGLIIAELAPDRATDVLMRARAIGESRIVCGVHYVSDIEAGRTNGSVLVAALHGDATFRADLDSARAEVAAARMTPHVGPGECVVPNAAAMHPPY